MKATRPTNYFASDSVVTVRRRGAPEESTTEKLTSPEPHLPGSWHVGRRQSPAVMEPDGAEAGRLRPRKSRRESINSLAQNDNCAGLFRPAGVADRINHERTSSVEALAF